MWEKQISSTCLYDGAILRVEKDEVELEDGSRSIREVVHNSGGVAVLAIDAQEQVILVKQFRYPSKEVLYELPGGKQEAGESIVEAGMRELREETGYITRYPRYFGYLYPTVAYASEVIHLVLAEHAVFLKQELDEGEAVEVVRMPLHEALRLIESNEIKDAKTIIALLKYRLLSDFYRNE